MIINYPRPTVTPATATRGSLAHAAEAQVADVLSALAAGEVEHYGSERRTSRTFYLALNGPDSRITFTLADDGEPIGAVVVYTDGGGQSAASVPEPYVSRLYAALSAYGN
ncbi:hypothetical protein [Micromonospora chalcea]|uniref:hypothetical protein n=1 Tax=Micromonospora chalcea TaxID=1874 RepID=UPI003D755A37